MATARHPGGSTVEERFRLNAEEICKLAGDDWRREAAEAMRCAVDDVGAGPVSRHRDSEPLARSNFRVILRALKATDERVTETRFRHWGVGWIDEIVVPLDNPALIQRIEAWVTALEGYAAADDYDLADLEAEDDASRATFDPDGDSPTDRVPDPRRPRPPEAASRIDPPPPPKRIDPPSL